MIIEIIIIILIIVLSIILSFGKWFLLVAGYHPLYKKNKDHSSITRLFTSIGMLLFSFGFDISLLILSDILAMKIFFDIGLVLLLGTIIVTIGYVNRKSAS